jgi:hypothetical protein
MNAYSFNNVEPVDIKEIIHDYNFITDTTEGLEILKESILEDMTYLVARTREEIANLFTINEAKLLVGITNSSVYSRSIPAKAHLLASIIDSIELEGSDAMFDVDGDALISKIKSLSEFQAYVVIAMATNFLKCIKGFFDDEDLKKCFCIS